MLENVMKHSKELLEALLFDGKVNDAFYVSVKVAISNEKYNKERMIKNCKNSRHSYCQMSSLEDELKEFSRIYNHNIKKDENKIFFEDYMRNRGHNVRSYDSQEKTFDSSYYDDDVSTL